MTDTAPPIPPVAPDLADLQHWTWVIGRAQQMMLEHGLAAPPAPSAMPVIAGFNDPATIARATDFWREGLSLWQRLLDPAALPSPPPDAARDRRFKAAAWSENPLFAWLRDTYLTISDHLLRGIDALEGVDERQKGRLRFLFGGMIDAASPSNFPFTNPEVIERTITTRGENLLAGLRHMLDDIARGQLTHTDRQAFEVGRNLAVTPGKVVKRTPLFELIQYSPATADVLAVPLVIFPPWINRFYILDLTPEKSFIRWCVDQGITVFVVSWKSADATMTDIVWDDYIAAQIDAIDTVRTALDVPAVHTIGYCVAGTTLAATLALLAARGEAGRVASATFFTAQVDFTRAGDLMNFITDDQLAMIRSLSPDGFLDGRYMALTFNMLRGRDLIWSYVTNNYLLGNDYPPFDLLHWNGDTTNLPARWHLSYLTDLYRDNLLVVPGALSIGGTPIDLTRIATPCYIQAGREDHIAPPESVWHLTRHIAGPARFVLAGSGHIAGVVNPPAQNKYQYWTNPAAVESLDAFLAGATETKGSWWPDWAAWLRGIDSAETPAKRGRIPGKGRLKALEDAPGSYVRAK